MAGGEARSGRVSAERPREKTGFVRRDLADLDLPRALWSLLQGLLFIAHCNEDPTLQHCNTASLILLLALQNIAPFLYDYHRVCNFCMGSEKVQCKTLDIFKDRFSNEEFALRYVRICFIHLVDFISYSRTSECLHNHLHGIQ